MTPANEGEPAVNHTPDPEPDDDDNGPWCRAWRNR